MAVYTFDGHDLKMMLKGSLELLGQSRSEIDALNVFPVPDGDTGTNMYHTLVAAVNEAHKTASNHIGLVAEAAARGGLIGARGNSGVILSQILHGFASSLRNKEKATADDISHALESGANAAYRAVMSPVEGTILTVVRKSAEGAASRRSGNLLRLMISVLRNALTALRETPDMLPVLKQAGVVDAGGKGYVIILEGILRSLKLASPTAKTPEMILPVATEKAEIHSQQQEIPGFEINFLYCTELLIKGQSLPLEAIKKQLEPYGDCLMVVGDDNLAKVHIHSNNPGQVLECCLKYGSLHDLKINNMSDQNIEMIENFSKPYGIVSVGAGEGIIKIMKNIGADVVVAGGQTLNPSTEELLKAIDHVQSKRIILLPNNKNIILTAEQAARLSSKDITVIPSKSIPQGVVALLSITPQDELETTATKMLKSLKTVRTGEITRAIRDASYTNLTIKQGRYVGLADGDLISSDADMEVVAESLLRNIVEGEGRMITFYYGEDIKKHLAEDLSAKMQELFPDHDFEIQFGGQPVYDLIISVE